MKIYLLTHQRESERPTNTGKLAIELFPKQIVRIIWSRVFPDQKLQQLAKLNQVALIHPSGSPLLCHDNDTSYEPDFQRFILLDATWQESQKILNKTPYLKQLKTFSLQPEFPSKYQLRRNQKANGLCTAECIIELFKTHNEIKKARVLSEHFESFNQRSR